LRISTFASLGNTLSTRMGQLLLVENFRIPDVLDAAPDFTGTLPYCLLELNQVRLVVSEY
jgi:hypothetical protein